MLVVMQEAGVLWIILKWFVKAIANRNCSIIYTITINNNNCIITDSVIDNHTICMLSDHDNKTTSSFAHIMHTYISKDALLRNKGEYPGGKVRVKRVLHAMK